MFIYCGTVDWERVKIHRPLFLKCYGSNPSSVFPSIILPLSDFSLKELAFSDLN